MKKYVIIAIIFLTLIISLGISIKSCSNIKQEKARLENKLNENIYPDDNSTIIIVNEITDTIPIQDTIIIPINQDSIDRVELIRDSIAFRKITIKINGGLNGFADRYAMWLRARNSINK